MLQRDDHVTVLPPQEYCDWLRLLHGCYFVLSDSGGAQEEAPWLKKPVLVLREETERPDVVEAGAAKLVGSDPERVYKSAAELLDDPDS
ncbi:MAG: UDP-N-acetylglucosamine 2-epimerase [Planctomycetes bacterium]|nr:UDP-N-acetylglucosamine 2-epimerase [Planctomycetota bacterium]